MIRTIRRTTGILSALLLLGAISLSADTLVEKFDATYPLQGSSFSLSNVNGSIEILAGEGPNVRIEAEKRITTRDRSTAAEAMKSLRIEIRNDASGMEVETRHPKRSDGIFEVFDFFSGRDMDVSVSYRVTVPRGAKVSVDAVNSAVTIDGTEGGFDLETVNGRIEVTRGAGSFEASTVNGSIDAELLRVDPRKLEVSTVNGSVRLALPADIRADLSVDTVNGRIESELPLQASELGKRKVRGSINGGGSPIRISTVNGSVTLSAN